MNDVAVVTGYIMYYDMLENMNGSFFTKIDKAIEIAEKFTLKYPDNDYWIENDFEETINDFVIKYAN